MKKLLNIIYLLLIPLYSAFGQSQIGVSIHDTSMVAGETIFIPVYVDSSLTGENVSSYNFQFSFNDDYFIVDSAFSDGTISSSWGAVTYNTKTVERISVASAGSTDLIGTGILLYLRLKAIKANTLNLSFTDTTYNYFNEGNPRVLLDYGRISISAKPTIRVNPETELLTTGDTKSFTVSYGTAPYVWSVTNTSVASIDTDGLLTALSKGTTQVVAEDANGIIDTNSIVEIRAFRLSARDTSQYQGQIVDIPIYSTDLTGLNYTAGEFTLEMNENVLTPLEIVTSGTLLSGYTTPSFGFNGGMLKVGFAGDTPLSGAGILMIVRFQITSENVTDTYLTFSDILFNETDLGNGGRSHFNNLPLATLSISPTTGNLLVGEMLQFTASNGTAPYTWSVSNTALASIDATGILTATNGGVVVVSAEDSFGGAGNSGNINLYDTQVSIPDTTADIGDVIEIPIYMGNLSSSHSILSMQTEILFDSSKIKFDQVITEGTSTANWSFSANDLGNKVIIGGANTTGFNNAGAIVKLKFNVSPTVSIGNYSNITLNNFLFNEGSPNARIDNGRITISTSSIPNAPTGLVALLTGDTQVTLLWTDNSNNESGFKIERKIGVAGTWGQIATVSQNIATYVNSGLTLGTNYLYRVRAYNNIGDSYYSNEVVIMTTDLEFEDTIPTQFELFQNYPNPFNPSTIIRFSVPEISFVSIEIYNLLGEKVESLLNKEVASGFYETTWNATNSPSGIYLVSARLESKVSQQTHVFTKKAILLK